MSISHLARSIGESATLKLNERAKLLVDQNQPVIHLGGGEPKNKVPLTAILHSAARLTTGDVKYVPTDVTPSLKKAIIRYTEENYGWLVAPENVIVSSGAKQSLFNALVSLVDPQDEVIVLAGAFGFGGRIRQRPIVGQSVHPLPPNARRSCG